MLGSLSLYRLRKKTGNNLHEDGKDICYLIIRTILTLDGFRATFSGPSLLLAMIFSRTKDVMDFQACCLSLAA